MKSTIIALALGLAGTTAFAGNGAAESAIAEAIAAADRAASIGGEWRDTRAIIDEAKEAATAGRTEEALKLAAKAREQGELGYAQAARQR